MAALPDRTGRCDTGRPLCGKPARLYPAGWRCGDHVPRSHTRPSPARADGRP